MNSLSRRTFLTVAPMLVALPNIAYASERNHGDLLGPASMQPLPSMETNLLPLNRLFRVECGWRHLGLLR